MTKNFNIELSLLQFSQLTQSIDTIFYRHDKEFKYIELSLVQLAQLTQSIDILYYRYDKEFQYRAVTRTGFTTDTIHRQHIL
jgi:phosphopantetheine adenylyltransferase